MSDNLIDIRHLKKYFHVSSGLLHAVDDKPVRNDRAGVPVAESA